MKRTNVKLIIPVGYDESYVKLRKSLKSTHLIVCLNAVSEEKSPVLPRKQFQILNDPFRKERGPLNVFFAVSMALTLITVTYFAPKRPNSVK